MSRLRKVAIVGVGVYQPTPGAEIDISQANGKIGQHILEQMLVHGQHQITILTRSRTTQCDPNVTVRIIDYDSPPSLVAALEGQDALVITMANTAPSEQQLKLVEAAAAAKVPWILPNEWGSDTAHPYNIRAGIYRNKAAERARIEQLGVSSWIAVVSNQWYEMSLSTGRYGIDINKRTARIFDQGKTQTTTSTKAQVGRAVAKLLSLPVTGSSPCLADYANTHVYVKSFYVSQTEMLEAVQKNTGTSAADWSISHVALDEWLEASLRKGREGNHASMLDWIAASNFAPDSGNDFAVSKTTVNEMLNLPDEDFDEATRRAIKAAKEL